VDDHRKDPMSAMSQEDRCEKVRLKLRVPSWRGSYMGIWGYGDSEWDLEWDLGWCYDSYDPKSKLSD